MQKKLPKAITVLKKKGGVRQGMIMITDSIIFFTPSLTVWDRQFLEYSEQKDELMNE